MKLPKVQVSAVISLGIYMKLKEISEKEKVSTSSLVSQALIEFLKNKGVLKDEDLSQ